MQVENRKAVTINYTLKDEAGEVLDTSEGRDPLTYLHGVGNIVPGLEKALEGKQVGESLTVTVAPEEGYGPRDDRQIRNIPVRKLPEGKIEVGSRFRIQTDQGYLVATVTALRGDYATVDANHPLAGKTLHFAVTVVGIRDATEEELTHGHIHGPGGHH
jgi:FKBP-type peptidyl-prolyl cis-trans isomerase SlyD